MSKELSPSEWDARRALDDKLREALNFVCDYVCDNLPEDWRLDLAMYPGECNLELYNADGEDVTDEVEPRTIRGFIEFAKESARSE
jgi:hypothetical protein